MDPQHTVVITSERSAHESAALQHNGSSFLTFDPLPSVQLDLSGPLGDVGPGGDEGASWDGAVQSPLPHLRGEGRGGGGAGLHMTPTTWAADGQLMSVITGTTTTTVVLRSVLVVLVPPGQVY